jgi:hypothetical protein
MDLVRASIMHEREATVIGGAGQAVHFGWAVDPEGTRFEIWEPPPGR